MKKTYVTPTVKAIPVQVNQIICTSVESNVDFVFGGETPATFDESFIR